MNKTFGIIASLLLFGLVSSFIYKKLWPGKPVKHTLFSLLSPDSTNIHFANKITTSDSLNILTFEYIYNGGGVGVGDFNNDGLADLFLGGNMVPSRIYLNTGDFRFKDITTQSQISTDGNWIFGVSVVDINQDGWLDIYLSNGGPGPKSTFPNKLYINQGIGENNLPQFVEMSEQYRLADSGQSVQAVFFDYDLDGDLDMYQLTGGGFDRSPISAHPIRKNGSAPNTDRLYRNDFDSVAGHPVFTDVSRQAGITHEGFGLGVSIVDINDDSRPDIYVTNDYLSNDHLYINNGNGSFSEMSNQYFRHTSHFAMGNDVGDINNDGLFDLLAVDMLPDQRYERSLMLGPNHYDKFYYAVKEGYAYQYMRNTLQLNRGNGQFSEIGQLAGIYKTSWSWAALFADLDNDGFQDIFVTNGFGKNITDLDFVKYRSNLNATQGTNEASRILLDSLSVRPGIKTHPYAYRNSGNCTFTDVSTDWGFTSPTYSNGAAYVDLDNDGDLDLVTNNIDEPAHVYRNNTIGKAGKENHFIKVKLLGTEKNKTALGSRVTISHGGKSQVRYASTVRGFESSVDPVLHFGTGEYKFIDSIQVVWPDGKKSCYRNFKANELVVLDYADAASQCECNAPVAAEAYFSEMPSSLLNIHYRNKPNQFNDFNYERLLHRKYSQNGPDFSVGDVNGDGLQDFFVGGAYQQSGMLYLQNADGSFSGKNLSTNYDWSTDAGSLLFDAEGDGDLDLYVVSGGNEFSAGHVRYRHRLYKNDGKGNFSKDTLAIPALISSGSCVVAADFDQDGDDDLFIGGQVTPGAYPMAEPSYILRNDKGKFIDATNDVAPGFKDLGLVTSAIWTDFDNDNDPDLVIVGEWMPVTLFRNDHGKLVNITKKTALEDSHGWWQSIVGGDFDNDGDIDFIAGNWGLNSPYHASSSEPMKVCYKDFDRNGSVDPLMCYYENGVEYPATSWDILIEQLPALRKQIPTYEKYARTNMESLMKLLDTKDMKVRECKTLSTSYIENLGQGDFAISQLPVEFQFAPVFGIITEDINNDGNLDILATGNFHGADVVIGRYDAFKGLMLLGDGKGNFTPVSATHSGFMVEGDGRSLARIEGAGNISYILASQNADSLKIFKRNGPRRAAKTDTRVAQTPLSNKRLGK